MDSYRIGWSDRLSIGDDLIDGQHRTLIELIATLPETDGAGDLAALEVALAYANKHFRDEEAYLERIAYPGLPAQRIQHKMLTRTLVSYQRTIERTRGSLYSFKHFMFRWVRDHIMDDDRKVGEWLRARAAASTEGGA